MKIRNLKSLSEKLGEELLTYIMSIEWALNKIVFLCDAQLCENNNISHLNKRLKFIVFFHMFAHNIYELELICNPFMKILKQKYRHNVYFSKEIKIFRQFLSTINADVNYTKFKKHLKYMRNSFGAHNGISKYINIYKSIISAEEIDNLEDDDVFGDYGQSAMLTDMDKKEFTLYGNKIIELIDITTNMKYNLKSIFINICKASMSEHILEL